MAIFAGNFSFVKISIELRSRVLLNPWFKKSSFIKCCSRYYSSSSSGPVRYIPNHKDSGFTRPPEKSDRIESDECSDSIPSRAAKVPEMRPAFSMRDAFGDSRAEITELSNNNNMSVNGMEFLEWEEEGDFVDEAGMFSENGNGPSDSSEVVWKNKQEAERIAIEALAKRAFTTVELRKKLLGKKIPPVIIDSVLTDFKNRGLINDYLYAESYSQSRWSSSTWGPRRIKQGLRQKGVSEEDAKKAMEHVFEGDEEAEGEKETNLGMSKLSMERLIVQASKQWLRGQDVPLEKRKSRIVRWLQYRGFNWGVTSFVIKKLESQYQP